MKKQIRDRVVPTISANISWLIAGTVIRDRDALSRREVGDALVDQEGGCVREVDDDEEREAGEPGRVRLPLEPVEGLRHLRRREPVLLRVVEPAAVDAP